MIFINVITRILVTLRERGHRQYGEDVTELEHALQAAMLATRRGETPDLVAACLLHDYGHLLHDMGEDIAGQGVDAAHEEIGGAWLSQFFPATVTEPVCLHVAAKRYLCWRQPDYFAGLSEASRLSLRLQGGPMNDNEARIFARRPHAMAAVRLRQYDDAAKIPGLVTPDLTAYRDLLDSLVCD
ncbi:MAG: HD domain-containing protein [Blastocatellia bacterium]